MVEYDAAFEVSPAQADSPDLRTAISVQQDAALATRFAWKVYSIGWGITLSGAAYPTIVAFIFGLTSLVNMAFYRSMSPHLGEMVSAIFVWSMFGAVVGFIYAMMVCICVLPFVYFFVRSLSLRGSVVRLGAFSGGLVGFVAVLPLFLSALDWGQFVGMVLAGPALTTVLGQIGGAWGGWRVGSYEGAVAKEWVSARFAARRRVAKQSDAAPLLSPARFQFRIWHLLVISIRVSLLLTAIRLSGFDFGFAFAVLAGWVVFQAFTLWFGGILAMQLARWRARHKSRST